MAHNGLLTDNSKIRKLETKKIVIADLNVTFNTMYLPTYMPTLKLHYTHNIYQVVNIRFVFVLWNY